MLLESLGYRTDLMFARWNGEVSDLGEYLHIRTPSNPTYYWGNFLLFKNPPLEGDFERWNALFKGHFPESQHVALGIDGTRGETGQLQPFLTAGFDLEKSVVLTATQTHAPARMNLEVEVRPLKTDADWAAALELQILCRDTQHTLESYRVFKTAQLKNYRLLTDLGLGEWFGVFLTGKQEKGKLVADLGIFFSSEMARYQVVETHPQYRRQGLCGRLVFEASQYAFAKGAEILVMVADPEYHAARIYESVGFAVAEIQVGLQKF